ncbi:MAG: excinuclease ABC subunit UvrA, partial [Chlamydiia bacterium]|nr:excinuclease ABC subunit UvrA [Chlamydiia bacterium]
MSNQQIILKQVKVHNLKSVDLTLDRHQFIVFTGVSGSGKSSLAFDTLYVEGQRRYVESLSTQARRQLEEMAKPDLESAEGLTPTISIEQKTAGRNPRSTVGTLTEVYDYLRVLFARIGIPHCPVSGEPVRPQSREKIIKTVQTYPEGMKVLILAPYISEKKGEFKDDFDELRRQGFTRIRLDGQIVTLDEEISLDGSVTHSIDLVIDRLKVDRDNHSRIAESITQALNHADGTCIVLDAETQEETLFSMHAYSPKSGLSYRSLEPHDFSFNSPSGMCERCHGLGHVQEFNLDAIIDPNLSIAEDCCSIASSFQTVRYGNIYRHLAEEYGFSLKTPWKKLSKSAQEVFLSGTKKKWTRIRFVHPKTGAKWVDHVRWRGVLYEAHRRFTEAKSETYRKNMQKLMTEQTCSECGGSRLKPYPAATQVGKKRIQQLAEMTIEELHAFFTKLKLNPLEKKIALELVKEIVQRLHFLLNVGLNYLTLDRTAPTLSGGEAQRVRLASQIGCGLVGITYVLDEPSIGLHPRDNHKLIATLKNLRDMGNTVIVVEHDEETILEADRIVDVGPGPGVKGGEIVCNGTVSELLKNKHSLTGAYLSGKKKILIPRKRRKPTKDKLILKECSHNNLKAISPEFPLGLLIAITGVSGSGKSSLISDTLHPALAQHYHNSEQPVGAHKGIAGLKHLDKVIAIDQSPIGRNPRSNPGTYIKVFDDIRRLFSELPESKARGYTPGQFSFNVREGSCPECRGMGMIQIDMDFMEDEWITCPTCLNRRFDPETLAIYFKGKNIHDILNKENHTALQP